MRYRGFNPAQKRAMHRAGAAGHYAGNDPRQQKSEVELQTECDRWNEKYPIGTLVEYFRLINPLEEPEGRYVTRSAAQVMGGHSAVIWLQGKSGCVALEACVPEEKAEDRS
jgi:hypothetical protein